ncbi:MAG: Piwi domain-containing protein [Bacteroidaceae bacterium]
MNESLFTNTLAFEFPKEPKIFYFSRKDRKGVSLTKLSHQLFPCNIKEIFPDISNADTIYTSFDRKLEGFQSLSVNFSKENFAFVKRFYNREIKHYFTTKNILVEPTFIKDNQIWLRSTDVTAKKIKDCVVYDRFTIKVNYNHFFNTPEIVLSYDRQAKVYKKSVAAFLAEFDNSNDNPFEETLSESLNPADLLVKVIYISHYGDNNTLQKMQVTKFCRLKEWMEKGEPVNYNSVYPIINNRLGAFLGHDAEEEENENPYIKKNRYTKYLSKIFDFKNKYLTAKEFKNIIPVLDNFTQVQPGKTSPDSKKLIFGKNKTDMIPQRGVNNGPFKQPRHGNIQMFFIVPKEHVGNTNDLSNYLRKGYKIFGGLFKYIDVPVSLAPKSFNLAFENLENPLFEIEEKLDNQDFTGAKYLAIYLTPIGKHTKAIEQRNVYYKVKEALLKRNISSQCIETDKMLTVLKSDAEKGKDAFAYTLQNIAIAINAKLGGTPWKIAVPEYREIIIGVGAFKHSDTNIQYIGSAFSFDNTGAFNSFEYFHKDELKELVGSIESAIMDYRNTIANLERLVIHYYKDMREDEVEIIENMLYNIGVDVPVFVVTINKTESEDIVVFDNDFVEKMPYSGRYINLGNNTYLLCNNTRYSDNNTRSIEGYPFPVKLKIKCHSDSSLLTTPTINGLIDQVYQFSRIYWKSVKQQNLPVTIKYPEMIAQIAPHFTTGSIPANIGKDNLWFL